MRRFFLITAIICTCVLFSLGQAKRETDRDGRELVGPVRTLKIVPVVVESPDEVPSSGGWIPSEITFDKHGNIATDVQFDMDGKVVDRTIAETDAAGNKVKETHMDAASEIKYTLVLEYDRSGNHIEFKQIQPDGKVGSWSKFEYDKQGRTTLSSSLNTDGTINTTCEFEYDKNGRSLGEVSTMATGVVAGRNEYSYSTENGVEKTETRVLGPQGDLQYRFVETKDKNGDETQLQYDADGKLVERQIWEYSKRDTHGNWTVEIMTHWQDKDGKLTLNVKKRTTRTITYF